MRIAVVLGGTAVVLVLLNVMGVGLEAWFRSLFDALTAVDPEYVVLGLGLQTLETLLSGLAWLAMSITSIKLGVIAVFLAAYGIPVTLHTVMTVAGGSSLANVVSVTP